MRRTVGGSPARRRLDATHTAIAYTTTTGRLAGSVDRGKIDELRP